MAKKREINKINKILIEQEVCSFNKDNNNNNNKFGSYLAGLIEGDGHI
jgi:hypothetical protein